MKVVVQKDWAGYKKSEVIEIDDKDVLEKGLEIGVPINYFKNDDPNLEPIVTWKSHAHLIFSNWLNYCVYQETPFELK